jgi:hypothetical protein
MTNAAGTTALKLAGNSLANTLVGNAGNNLLNGSTGAETLTGLGGNDIVLFKPLPVPLISATPCNSRFSTEPRTLAELTRLKLMEE